MKDLRTKIAALALAMGLGGLGGFAIGSSKPSPGVAAAPPEGTKVVRRTIHAKRHRVKAAHPRRHSATEHTVASHPVSTGSSGSGTSESSSGSPVLTGSSGSSSHSGSGSHNPVHTGSSGSSGGGSSQPPVTSGSSGGGGGTGGGEDGGGEVEHDGGD